jgi:hypothetical protein
MRAIQFPRGKMVEVCHLCERAAKDTDDATMMEELLKRYGKDSDKDDET